MTSSLPLRFDTIEAERLQKREGEGMLYDERGNMTAGHLVHGGTQSLAAVRTTDGRRTRSEAPGRVTKAVVAILSEV